MTNTPTQPELKRYSIDTWFLYGSSIYNSRQDEVGEWCKAADALAIAAERDRLKAENEALKAALAETWQPVEKLEEHWTSQHGDPVVACLWNGILVLENERTDDAVSVQVSAEYRLCRKVATVAEPVLDWDKIDEEYKWFAVDSRGEGHVHTRKPESDRVMWLHGDLSAYIDVFNLNNIHWTFTLTERPNQPPAGVTKA